MYVNNSNIMARKGKHQVSFYVEKRKTNGKLIEKNVPINMAVTWNGNKMMFYTGYRIDIKSWKYSTDDGIKIQRVNKNTFNKDNVSSKTINGRLISLESAVNTLFDGSENTPTKEQLLAKLRAAINEESRTINNKNLFYYFEFYIDNAGLSDTRKKHMTVVLNHLKAFKSNLTLYEFNTTMLQAFRNYLKTDKESPKCDNTISNQLQRLRSFINYALRNDWTKTDPFKDFNIEPEVYGQPIYLTKEERDKLYNAELENEKLNRVRDMFILQCFIGCRVGDFCTLRKSNIIDGFIHYIPGKTKNENTTVCKVPLSDKAWSIINKYNLPGGELVPYISDQRYNEYLKQLFEKVELNRPVVRLNPQTKENEIVPLHTIATSHMARRTFVGLLHKTVKNEVIASMSGHVANSRAFHRYYKVDDESQIEAIKMIE